MNMNKPKKKLTQEERENQKIAKTYKNTETKDEAFAEGGKAYVKDVIWWSGVFSIPVIFLILLRECTS